MFIRRISDSYLGGRTDVVA